MIKYIFVINPISGGHDKTLVGKFIDATAMAEGFAYQVYTTHGKDDVDTLKRLVKSRRPKAIVAVGGDGTLLLCAIVAKNTSMLVGHIPCGSANGMARELGLPRPGEITRYLNNTDRYKECWRIIQRGRVHKIDLLRINKNHYALHLSDIGLNAKIIRRFEQTKTRGYLGYARLFLKEIRQKKRLSYRVFANGNKKKGKAYMIVIANATMYGTGAVINPIGQLSDGVFEICIVKQVGLKVLFRAVMSIFRKKILKYEDLMKVISCKKATVQLKKPESLQVDGEHLGEVKRVDINIMTRAVNIIH